MSSWRARNSRMTGRTGPPKSTLQGHGWPGAAGGLAGRDLSFSAQSGDDRLVSASRVGRGWSRTASEGATGPAAALASAASNPSFLLPGSLYLRLAGAANNREETMRAPAAAPNAMATTRKAFASCRNVEVHHMEPAGWPFKPSDVNVNRAQARFKNRSARNGLILCRPSQRIVQIHRARARLRNLHASSCPGCQMHPSSKPAGKPASPLSAGPL